MTTIPDAYRDLFEREAFAQVATLLPNGMPHVTPVWVDHDGSHVLVNTARGRQKTRNLERDPRVGLSVLDPEDPYRYVSLWGEATLTEEGAVEHIDTLAQRYMGLDEYPHHGEETGPRVLVRISPDRVITSG